MRLLLLSSLLLAAISSGCSKDKDESTVIGTVYELGGCYSDSWFVSVQNPNYKRQSFLCEPFFTTGFPTTDCSNSVNVRLPANLAVKGKRIKFKVINTEPSCLSWVGAPKMVIVKNLMEL